jgi:negative regulator of flagellin synthesis FlgM
MKIINNLYRIDTPLTQSSNASGKAAASDSASDGQPIRLSELSSQLHKLELKLSSEPGFDTARVEQIKNAVRDGGYKVNADAVADKIIQSIRELSGLHSGGENA